MSEGVPVAADICRGVTRLFAAMGWTALPEVGLPNGRRADLLALGPGNEFAIVEVKSSVVDFRTDGKWPEYREFCDRFFFAVGEDFPAELIPPECGLIIADRFAATLVRDCTAAPLPPARRRALTLRYAHLGAERLRRLADPEG